MKREQGEGEARRITGAAYKASSGARCMVQEDSAACAKERKRERSVEGKEERRQREGSGEGRAEERAQQRGLVLGLI